MRQLPPKIRPGHRPAPQRPRAQGVFLGRSSPTATCIARHTQGAVGPRSAAPNARSEAIAMTPRRPSGPRYKLGRISSPDPDGYHRVACPPCRESCAARCGPTPWLCPWTTGDLRPSPQPPTCLSSQHHRPAVGQRQDNPKHDYPSAATAAPTRRTAVERAYASLKDRPPPTSTVDGAG